MIVEGESMIEQTIAQDRMLLDSDKQAFPPPRFDTPDSPFEYPGRVQSSTAATTEVLSTVNSSDEPEAPSFFKANSKAIIAGAAALGLGLFVDIVVILLMKKCRKNEYLGLEVDYDFIDDSFKYEDDVDPDFLPRSSFA